MSTRPPCVTVVSRAFSRCFIVARSCQTQAPADAAQETMRPLFGELVGDPVLASGRLVDLTGAPRGLNGDAPTG